MEKLKHLVNPGKEKDDEVMYGTGRSSDPLHSGTSTNRPAGDGSHFTPGDHHTGHGTSGIGSTSGNTAGPHASNLANKIDPRVDSDRDGSRTAGSYNTSGGLASGYGAGTSTTGPTTSTRGHGDPMAGNINKPLPHTPASFTGPPGTGPTLGNLPDRTVGSTGTPGTTAAAPHHQQHQIDPYRNDPSYGSTAVDTTSTQRSYPLTGGTTTGPITSGLGHSGHGPVLPTTAPHRHHDIPEAGVTSTSQGGLMHHYHTRHDINPANPDPNKVDPRIAETVHFGHTPPEALRAAASLPVATTGVAAAAPVPGHDYSQGSSVGETSSTAGPHKSNLLNKLDPRVDSDQDGSRTYGAVPGTLGGTSHGTTGGGMEPGYSSVPTGIAGPTATGATGSGYSSGPHSSTIANRLDPRVDSDRDGSRTLGASGTHHGPSMATVGGTAAAGAAAYEIGRHHEPSRTADTTGPFGSSTTGPYGTTDRITEPSHTGHHYGRDPAAAGVGTVGASELSRREAERVPEYRTTEEDRHHHLRDDKHHHKEDKHHHKAEEEKHGHHGLLGFLHRDKDRQHDVEEPKPTHHGTATGVGAAGVGTAAALHERDDHPHKLHKDPPPEVLAQAQAQQASGERDPTAPEGHDRFVIEPHTGLPMNVGKYGTTGAGGTDGGPIPGYHEDPAHKVTGRIG